MLSLLHIPPRYYSIISIFLSWKFVTSFEALVYSGVHHSVNSGRVIASSFSAFRTIPFPTVPFHPISSICGIIFPPLLILVIYMVRTVLLLVIPVSYHPSHIRRILPQLGTSPSCINCPPNPRGLFSAQTWMSGARRPLFFPPKSRALRFSRWAWNHSHPCRALPFLALPCLALPCLALPCLALPCLALPCLALPYPVQGEGGNG